MALKQQSSLEFIVTYAWALIIVSLFVVTVFVLADSKPPAVYLGSSCNIQPLMPCSESLLAYNSIAPLRYYVVFTNQLGSVMYFPPNSLNVSTSSLGSGARIFGTGNCTPGYASTGATVLCTAAVSSPIKPAVGSFVAATFIISYRLCSGSSISTCAIGLYKSSGISQQAVSPSYVSLNNVTFITIPDTATVMVNGETYYNGISTFLPTGNYVMFGTVPSGKSFSAWSVTGTSSVTSASSQNTVLVLNSNTIVTEASS